MPTGVLADIEVTCLFLDGPDDKFSRCEYKFERIALQLSALLLFDHLDLCFFIVIIRFVALCYFKVDKCKRATI
jgi:hypothetical protein